MEQVLLSAENAYAELTAYIREKNIRKPLLVCGNFIFKLPINRYLQTLASLDIQPVRFSDFQPNPLFESVLKGAEVFRQNGCDSVIAIGGGSAIDVAKCVKLYADMPRDEIRLNAPIRPNRIPLIAIPTTAGTGSEATCFAVVYANGEKQSVADESCLPAAVVLDASALDMLPDYQRKSSMLDALCHAIEAYWSVNATSASREYSRRAIAGIFAAKDDYLANLPQGNISMLQAANLAGQAINIAKTTAGHAMCYKLTSLYGISHGHAAALCVKGLWPFMAAAADKQLSAVFNEIAAIMGCTDTAEATEKFAAVLAALRLEVPEYTEAELNLLVASVNTERLKNNPVQLSPADIGAIYRKILRKKA